jgi:hypothetical protein
VTKLLDWFHSENRKLTEDAAGKVVWVRWSRGGDGKDRVLAGFLAEDGEPRAHIQAVYRADESSAMGALSGSEYFVVRSSPPTKVKVE